MKEFLNQAMRRNRSGDTEVFQKFLGSFSSTCESIVRALGEKPFHVRGPLNLAAIDGFMAIVMRRNPSIEKIKCSHEKLMSDENYKQDIFFNTSDGTVIKDRMKKVVSVM
ncbi:hypothetical protein [Brucella vulpis]|uniref:hypothetical protein n=1 Tax=Brucella vulpis TaxID=981386 RepID=UPI004032886F